MILDVTQAIVKTINTLDTQKTKPKFPLSDKFEYRFVSHRFTSYLKTPLAYHFSTAVELAVSI